jgi:myo-inositol-1-phosphate synthase
MKRSKTGVWLIGALGSISTTVMVGALAVRKGLVDPVGMITAGSLFDGVPLPALEDLEFGGCDIRPESLKDTATHLIRETGVIRGDLLPEILRDIQEIEPHISRGTASNCGEAIEQLAARPAARECRPPREEIDLIRSRISAFKAAKSLDEVVVVNLASTEPSLDATPVHEDLASLEACIDGNGPEAFRASTLYAYAAIREGCPFVNFTPSQGALLPALVQLAGEIGVPVMGNDGKTGETLVKSALAPMFSYRNLEVLSWEGFNILGNLDGRVLENPSNKAAKIQTKDQVLSKILGYSPHSRVHIDYVPSLDDQKTAWDFIHFRGFLGARMSLQFIWQGFDSILAAPLVLDLARLAELAKRRGESGLMPHLASYFKAPLGVEAFGLHEQYGMLADYAARVRAELEPTAPPGK